MESVIALALGVFLLLGADMGVRSRYRAQGLPTNERDIKRGVMVVRAIGVLALIYAIVVAAHLISS